ncbi:MAG: hypothetical protein PW843_17840 [Azospirillaceae bacterium]|nr:hypothetical protein [Azospirillaceae bacterium]
MVKIAILMASATLFLASPAAQAGLKTIQIKSIVVDRSGTYGSPQDGRDYVESCARLQATSATVLAWMKKAREVSHETFLQEATVTQCSASGTLTTVDGKSYAWKLDVGGEAVLSSPSEPSIFLLGSDLNIPDAPK